MFANAGIERNGPAHRLQLADWEKTLRVNLTGVFLTCEHAIVVWLPSEEASYVTGSHLVCDGGLLARSADDF